MEHTIQVDGQSTELRVEFQAPVRDVINRACQEFGYRCVMSVPVCGIVASLVYSLLKEMTLPHSYSLPLLCVFSNSIRVLYLSFPCFCLFTLIAVRCRMPENFEMHRVDRQDSFLLDPELTLCEQGVDSVGVAEEHD